MQSIYEVMVLIGVRNYYPYENVIVYVMADISCKDIWCHVDSRRCIEILLSNQAYPEFQHLTVISTEGGRRQTGEGGSRQQAVNSRQQTAAKDKKAARSFTGADGRSIFM